MSNQNVLFFGASRGCGFYTMLHLLRSGGHATLLLRNPSTVTSSPEFSALSASERARANLVQGDAFSPSEVRNAFAAAGPGCNTVISTLGGKPSSKFSLTRGVMIDPPQICARAVVVLLSVMQELPRPQGGWRLVVGSTMGMGEKAKELPFLWKWPLYGWLLKEAHSDKEALEYLALCASVFPTPTTHLPEPQSLPADWSLLRQNWLDELIILRPAWFTDGDETGKFRTGVSVKSAYTIRRTDVGVFIFRECLRGEDKWVGEKGVVVAY